MSDTSEGEGRYSDTELAGMEKLLEDGHPGAKNIGGELLRARQVVNAARSVAAGTVGIDRLRQPLDIYDEYMKRPKYSQDST